MTTSAKPHPRCLPRATLVKLDNILLNSQISILHLHLRVKTQTQRMGS